MYGLKVLDETGLPLTREWHYQGWCGKQMVLSESSQWGAIVVWLSYSISKCFPTHRCFHTKGSDKEECVPEEHAPRYQWSVL